MVFYMNSLFAWQIKKYLFWVDSCFTQRGFRNNIWQSRYFFQRNTLSFLEVGMQLL